MSSDFWSIFFFKSRYLAKFILSLISFNSMFKTPQRSWVENNSALLFQIKNGFSTENAVHLLQSSVEVMLLPKHQLMQKKMLHIHHSRMLWLFSASYLLKFIKTSWAVEHTFLTGLSAWAMNERNRLDYPMNTCGLLQDQNIENIEPHKKLVAKICFFFHHLSSSSTSQNILNIQHLQFTVGQIKRPLQIQYWHKLQV